MGQLPRIALTSGEPAGIGPELCLQLAHEEWPCALVCVGDRELLAERARALSLPVALEEYVPGRHLPHRRDVLVVRHVPLAAPSTPGRLDARNARYVLDVLDVAIDGTLSGEFSAIVTAPVQKSIVNEGGVAFTGHTEYLAERTGASRPVMMLTAGGMRVALATTHLPLREVSGAITVESLVEILGILDRDLRRHWRIERPRIAVCGLNPHAGEGGHLGDEELRIIGPAIERARAQGIHASGPLPADTVFVPRILGQYDAVLAMYHDQGLPVIKHAGFGHAVNVTLGLPIVRTSVDHGTALELAGTGRADAGSLAAALRLAIEMVTGE
ncbi:MAG: 4-hydroxythreonine-4-phosphate dehydrogenase PdxA [Pseudomonadota bacterium]